VEVASDPQGDVTLPGGAANDLLSIHVAEPATAGAAQLVFTTTVADLSSLPPNSNWRTSFVGPTAVACGPLGTPSSTYFVAVDTNNLTPACRYGCLDGNIYRSLGTADGCAVDAAAGTLTVTVLNSRVGNLQPGQALAGVTGRAEMLVGAGGTGLLQVVDTTSPGSYTLRGNGSCAAGAPNANDDAASTQEGRPVSVAVLANDSDPDGDAISIQAVGAAQNGATSDNGDGTVTYAPNAGFAGTDRFDYTIADAGGLTDTAEVTITVNPKCPPTPTGGFADDMETGGQPGWETTTGVNTLGPLSATWAIVEDEAAHSPTHSWFSDASSIEVKDDYLVSPPLDLSSTSRLVFWHRHGFEAGEPGEGYDGGVLEVSTDGGGSWVDVTERGAFAEGGYDATIQPNFGSPIAGRPAWSGSRPEPGRVVVDLGGFAGSDVRVRWRLTTDQVAIGAVPGEGWWIDDVLFTDLLEPVATCNEPPVANADAATTDFETAVTVEVLANDRDPDGDELALDGVTAAANGSAIANADGTVTYTPNAGFSGSDGFTYTVSDGNGGTAAAPVTVTVREAGNRAPVVADDAAATQENKPVSVNVLANDSDPDGDALEIVALGVAPNGRVVAKKNGAVSYKPNQGFAGTDQFTYTVSDGHGHTATATVRVTVSSR
jgi:hypothetical protein